MSPRRLEEDWQLSSSNPMHYPSLLRAARLQRAIGAIVTARHGFTCEALEPRRLLSSDTGPGGFDYLPSERMDLDTARVQQVTSLIRLDTFRADARFAGIDGTGFSIAIIDTGIDLNHPYFGPDANSDGISDRIVFSYDFYGSDDSDASDFNGHGSNVASIALSSDSTRRGIAPGANIIALKVFPDGSGGSPNTDTEQALQWLAANAVTYNIASVNLSLGAGNYSTPQTNHSRSNEFAALAAGNVLSVAAAGNSFYSLGSVQGISYPAADVNVLSVGAVYDANIGGVAYGDGAVANTTAADRVAPFTQRHTTMLGVLAPGAPSTGANQSGGTVTMHGTSQSSPVIAGVAALSQQLALQTLGRRLTPSEFRGLLRSSAVTLNDGDNENDNVVNTGANFPRVDMMSLGEAILAMAPDTDDQISEAIAGAATQAGSIASVVDVDMHRFTVAAGQRMAFDLDRINGSLLDSYLRLFDASGAQIAFNNDANSPGETASPARESYIDHTFTSAGTYYLGVSGFANTAYNPVDGTGDVSGSTGDYSLIVTDLTPPPEVRVLLGTVEISDGQVAAIDFGTVTQGEDGPTRTFTVFNDGGATLTADALTVPAGYVVTENLSPSIMPGASDTFSVRLESTTLGTMAGAISFSNSDADENPFDFPITGTVTSAPPAATFKFDFGTSTSPVETGYVRVSDATSFSATTGFGWTAGARHSRDRGGTSDLTRDIVLSTNATFEAAVDNGAYDVTLTVGDTFAHDQQGIFLEGVQYDSITTASGQFIVRMYQVSVTDGQLTLGLLDLGGADANAVINALELVPASPPPPVLAFDFGTADSPVAAGYTGVTNATSYSDAAGFGWTAGTRHSRDRGGTSDLTRDIVFSTNATFEAAVDNAAYDVTLTVGDTFAHEQQGIFLEGVQYDSITTAANQFLVRTYQVSVTDGRLTLGLRDLGGADAYAVINALEIAAASSPPPPPAAHRFDFGPAGSPVPAGYTGADTAAFSSATGFGWTAGTRHSRDRGGTSDLTRDLVFSTNATFEAVLDNGTYDITVTVGDSFAHDQQGIFLEGVQFDSITTASGQFIVRTYRVSVTDGRLTLGLLDLGGTDANAVINALEIVAV